MKFKKNIMIVLAAFLIVNAFPMTAMAKEGNWGLGYGAEGQKPSGQDSIEELAKYNAYYVDPGDEKVIYLTFDAGYENGYTESILDVLKETEVPAAFFMVGTYIKNHPEIIKRMEEEGHIVGNHSMTHPDMTQIGEKMFRKELEDTAAEYMRVTGKEMPKFYRPPQGKYSLSNLQQASDMGYTTVFWSLAYVDWNVDSQPTKEQAFSKLLPRLHPGTILLLHSTSQTNADILKELITKYREMGYEFKSLHDLGSEN